MAVTNADMKVYLSGGPGASTPAASIGDEISSTQITDNSLENLFDNIAPAEATAGLIDYRCFYLKNTHASDDLDATVIWINSNTPSTTTTIAIGLDPAGVGDGAATGVAATPVNDVTAPAGVTFSTPTTEGAGLAIGQIDNGECQAVWVRRTITAGTASAAHDAFTLKISGTPL